MVFSPYTIHISYKLMVLIIVMDSGNMGQMWKSWLVLQVCFFGGGVLQEGFAERIVEMISVVVFIMASYDRNFALEHQVYK